MVENPKKKAAAIAGVMAYLRSEEEAVMLSCMAAPQATQSRSPAGPASSPWAMMGRNDLMQNRAMMQMKAFHGYRPR